MDTEESKLLNIHVTICDRPYRLKVKPEEEETVRKAARIIAEKIKELQNLHSIATLCSEYKFEEYKSECESSLAKSEEEIQEIISKKQKQKFRNLCRVKLKIRK